MASPIFVGQNSSHTDVAGTTGAVNAPSDIVVGDFMLLIVGFGSGASITTLAGWTLAAATQTAGTTKSGVFTKVVTSADIGATFTWTFTGTTTTSVFAVAAWRNVIGTVVDAAASLTTTTTQAVTAPNVTAVSKNNVRVFTRTTRDDTTTTSNVICTSSTTGAVKRSEDVCTVAGLAVHGAAIWDWLAPAVGAGTRAGGATSCATTTPTDGCTRTFTLQSGGESGIWDINQQTMNRSVLW